MTIVLLNSNYYEVPYICIQINLLTVNKAKFIYMQDSGDITANVLEYYAVVTEIYGILVSEALNLKGTFNSLKKMMPRIT